MIGATSQIEFQLIYLELRKLVRGMEILLGQLVNYDANLTDEVMSVSPPDGLI